MATMVCLAYFVKVLDAPSGCAALASQTTSMTEAKVPLDEEPSMGVVASPGRRDAAAATRKGSQGTDEEEETSTDRGGGGRKKEAR